MNTQTISPFMCKYISFTHGFWSSVRKASAGFNHSQFSTFSKTYTLVITIHGSRSLWVQQSWSQQSLTIHESPLFVGNQTLINSQLTGRASVGSLKITEDKSSKSRIQTPDAGLVTPSVQHQDARVETRVSTSL